MSKISATMYAKRVRENKGAKKKNGELSKSKRIKPENEKGFHE